MPADLRGFGNLGADVSETPPLGPPLPLIPKEGGIRYSPGLVEFEYPLRPDRADSGFILPIIVHLFAYAKF